MRMKFIAMLGLGVMGFVITGGTVVATAPDARAQAGQQVTLPPALRAAVLSGNAAAVQQAINVLSGGDPVQGNALSQQVGAMAEQMLATNPVAALAAAQGALAAVNVNQGASNALGALTQIARVATSPQVQQVNPNGVTQLASQIATATTNPAVYGTNPAGAIQILADTYTAAGGSASSAGQAIAVLIRQGSANPALTAQNPDNPGQMLAILNEQSDPTPTTRQEEQVNDRNNTPLPVRDVFKESSPT